MPKISQSPAQRICVGLNCKMGIRKKTKVKCDVDDCNCDEFEEDKEQIKLTV